jgi:hypothetical protein
MEISAGWGIGVPPLLRPALKGRAKLSQAPEGGYIRQESPVYGAYFGLARPFRAGRRGWGCILAGVNNALGSIVPLAVNHRRV